MMMVFLGYRRALRLQLVGHTRTVHQDPPRTGHSFGPTRSAWSVLRQGGMPQVRAHASTDDLGMGLVEAGQDWRTLVDHGTTE